MFQRLKYLLLIALMATPAEAQVKFSAIHNGGALVTSTDQLLAVRSGATDQLVTPGAAAGEALGGPIVDDGAGNLTISTASVLNAMLANSSMTIAGHVIALGGTQTIACGDLSNSGTACTAVAPVNTSAVSHNFFTAYTAATGAFTKAQPACGDLSDSSTGCTTTVGSLASLSSINNSNWSGTALAIGNGGTGQTSASAAFNALSPLTTSGDVLYGGASGVGTRLAANATGTNKYLQSVSSGTPVWAQVAFGDLSGQATNAQLATQTANTVLGALTATTPSGLALPSCTDSAGNHLNYTSGTGFSCGTSDSHAGTVTSVTFTGDGIVDSSTPSSAVTTTGTVAATAISQAKNIVLAGPASGSNAAPTFRALVGADLPNPAAGTLGGVESLAAVSHEWINTISTAGVPSATQPAFTDISGQATNAQLATQTANTLLGALTATTPSGQAVPSCTDTSGNHLNWTSGTGFSCGTTDAHVGTVTSVGTSAPLAGGAITGSGTISITGAAGQVLAGATPAFTATPVLGTNASAGGTIGLANGGALGTTITLQNLGNTSAYNFNLPTTPGSAGQILTSQGGGINNMTWATDNVGGGMFTYSDNGLTLTANTYFAPIGGGGVPQTTEAAVDVPSPSATTVANLQVGISNPIGAGNTLTVTLRDGGVSQAVTCQIAGASAVTCNDLTHSFNVVQGDLIDWQVVTTGTVVATPTVTISSNNGTSNVGVTSVATNNGLTGGTITTTGTIGLASVANNSVLCNNSGGSAAPTVANCTVTGTGAAMLAASPTASGTLTAAALTTTGNNYLNGGYIENGTPFTANTGTSLALNIDNGPKQVITVTGAVAMTLGTPTHFGSATYVIKQDGSGHIYSITGCKWTGGTSITYSTAASKIDIISILYDGTNFYCTGGAAFS